MDIITVAFWKDFGVTVSLRYSAIVKKHNIPIETDIPIEELDELTVEDTLSILGELGVDTDDQQE